VCWTPELPLCKPVIAAGKSCGVPQEIWETILALGEKQMAHDHGNEYQVRIIHADGTEKLSGWMNSESRLLRRWLRSTGHKAKPTGFGNRNVLCPDCLDKEQIIILNASRISLPTIPPPRLLLSGGSGVEELVRIARGVIGSRH
jgi:hypothetical protein